MDLRQAFVTYTQAAELMQPGNTALDHPARRPQPAAVFGSALGQCSADSARMQDVAMGLRIVAAIALHAPGLASRAPGLAGDGRDRFDQRQQLRDVVAVGLGEDHAQREALRFDQEVVLAASLTAIGWVRSSFFPPCTARIEELSTITRDRSSLSAPRSFDSNT